MADPQAQDRPADDVLGRLAGVHRPGEVEALGAVAAHPDQALDLGLRLDALGDRRRLQAVGELDDAAGERLGSDVVGDLVDEALVDLDDLDREAPEIAQRRVAGSEVVDREGDPEALELAQPAGRGLGLAGHDALGDLERQELRRQVAVLEREADRRDEAGMLELDAGQVDVDR